MYASNHTKKPNKHVTGPEKPTSSKGIDRCVKEWVSLNSFVAHLTRAHAVPLEDYALQTFSRAFGLESDLDENIYHIPAAAAWLNIMGQEIYMWSLQNPGEHSPSGFELQKWHEWKHGFEACSNSNRFHPQIRNLAEMAINKMKTLETTGISSH